MSETSILISCTGKITRAELAQAPTPPSTATHVPIRHTAVVDALGDTLSHRQISVVDEEFAVSRDGMEMFGVLDLATGFEGCRFAIGIRNANNKRFRLGMHFRPQDDLGCFFWPTMPTRLAKKRLVHAEHEVLIFLYVKWASVLDIEGDYLI